MRIYIKNVPKQLSSYGKSREPNILATHRETTTIVFMLRTSRRQIVIMMSKSLYASRRTLWRNTKLRDCREENNEGACWDLICRKPYQDRIPEGIREKVIEFSKIHFRAIQNKKTFCDGAYLEECVKVKM